MTRNYEHAAAGRLRIVECFSRQPLADECEPETDAVPIARQLAFNVEVALTQANMAKQQSADHLDSVIEQLEEMRKKLEGKA